MTCIIKQSAMPGGNMSAVIVIQAKEKNGPKIKVQIGNDRSL